MEYEANVTINGELQTVKIELDYKDHWSRASRCFSCDEWWITRVTDDQGAVYTGDLNAIRNQLNEEDVTRFIESRIN